MKLSNNIAWFALVLVIGTSPLMATPVTFAGSGTGVDGASLSAQAIFEIAGNTLTVTLVNGATDDNTNSNQDVPGNTLTGVFFALTGSPMLTPVSATIGAESIVNGFQCDIGPCDSEQTNVGGEFIYGTGAFPGGADRGMASSGYISGPSGNFNGPNLDDPNAPDGPNFGIISADFSFLPNGGLESVPLIQTQVIFILTGVSGLTEADISNVSFQYGTSLTEPNITGECIDCPQDTPEPSSLLLLGCGLAVLGLYRRRNG